MYWEKCYVCLFVLLAGLLSVGLGIEQDGQSELFYAMFASLVKASHMNAFCPLSAQFLNVCICEDG